MKYINNEIKIMIKFIKMPRIRSCNDYCKEDGCEKRATFGIFKEKACFCKKHKEDNMIDVKNKRCDGINDDGTVCDKINPVFNIEGGKGRFCAKHKQDHMVDVTNKRCEGKNDNDTPCTSQPAFDIEGGKGRFCADHKKDGMINVKSKRCKTPLCEILAMKKKYKGYCYRCFINTFPDSTIVCNHKTKERVVTDYIREQFPDLTIILDKRIEDGCSSRRPDIFIDLGEYTLVIEIDETQHNTYECSCENKRMMELFQDAGSRHMVMIRFNPDQYYDHEGKSIPSCWEYTKDKGLCHVKPNKQKEWQNRLDILQQYVKHICENRIDKEIHVEHLFYDGWSL